ncbi:PREDICTED: uncharacterized protein LOC105532221 [Mandrillus leucophaeus]|uniref:uncharacterized protein LOC105532221 n=1 Tax=Mandrillus leucophaeus TaxID=9568 RepID=UPI0005F365E8|nr:PREDICTED: uncharacterized protein LOC105532221 [Mandrillus leucophaeus]
MSEIGHGKPLMPAGKLHKVTFGLSCSLCSLMVHLEVAAGDPICSAAGRPTLQAAQEELRRQRDRLEEEQEDAVQDGVRVRRELERSHRQLEQLEGKRSVLAKELVEVREALSRATLQRDMLQAEKAEVAEALTKAEAGRVELELSMTKLRAEEASLQDSLSKLSALNESLAQDKLDLNRLVAQLEEDKAALQVTPTALGTAATYSLCTIWYPHLQVQGYQEKAQQRQLREQGAVEHGECLLGAPEPGHSCVPASLSATRLQLPLLGFFLVALTPQMLTDCREAPSCLLPPEPSNPQPMLNLPCHPVALMGRIARLLQMASPWKHRLLNQLQAAGWQSHVPLPETHTCNVYKRQPLDGKLWRSPPSVSEVRAPRPARRSVKSGTRERTAGLRRGLASFVGRGVVGARPGPEFPELDSSPAAAARSPPLVRAGEESRWRVFCGIAGGGGTEQLRGHVVLYPVEDTHPGPHLRVQKSVPSACKVGVFIGLRDSAPGGVSRLAMGKPGVPGPGCT